MEGDTLLVVYFEGVQAGPPVSGADLAWTIRDEACAEVEAIGLGAPIQDLPILMLGVLSEQASLHSLQGGSNPLLALIYVVPAGMTGATLLSPQGVEHPVDISSDWLPAPENLVDSFDIQMEGGGPSNMGLTVPLGPMEGGDTGQLVPGGDDWTTVTE